LISETFARKESRSGEIRLIPLKDVELWRELGMVHDRHRTLPRAAVAFIKLVRGGVLSQNSQSGGDS
jgi:DNA-binding transcriptional LysR family regulator